MTRWPTLVLIQVWMTPEAEVRAATATHRGYQPGQQPQVPVRQGGVDDRAQQERRGQPHQGGGREEGGDDGQLPPVRAEQPPDPAQRHLACLRLFRGGDGRPAAATAGGIPVGVG
jgi:hypothetical protein